MVRLGSLMDELGERGEAPATAADGGGGGDGNGGGAGSPGSSSWGWRGKEEASINYNKHGRTTMFLRSQASESWTEGHAMVEPAIGHTIVAREHNKSR